MATKKKTVDPTEMETAAPAAAEIVQPDQAVETVEQPAEKEAACETAVEGNEANISLFQVAFCRGLNLREGPGVKSPVMRVLPTGTEVFIDPASWVSDGTGVWFPVTVDGVNGFINGQYLVQIGG